MTTSPCKAVGRGCGTPSGWTRGGRCAACRTAHNAETNRYRGLTARQLALALAALRAGASAAEAAAQADCTERSLQQAARANGELRMALDGQPEHVQTVARQGDFLMALTRTGSFTKALQAVGIDEATVDGWRANALYANAEDAVLLLAQSAHRSMQRYRERLTDEELSSAADLLEAGCSVKEAAAAIEVSGPALRNAAKRHRRLAKALPALRQVSVPGGGKGKMTPESEQRLRELWADRSFTVAQIAGRIGVHPKTLHSWRKALALPLRRGQREEDG